MFINPDFMPSTPLAQVEYVGHLANVNPPFDEEHWEHLGTAKAERVHYDEGWQFSSQMPPEINPASPGFWTWGDLLIRVVPATILESGLYVFRRKDGQNA